MMKFQRMLMLLLSIQRQNHKLITSNLVQNVIYYQIQISFIFLGVVTISSMVPCLHPHLSSEGGQGFYEHSGL